MKDIVSAFKQALLALDRVEVQTILNHSLKKWNPIQSTESIVIPAMEQIGSDWEDGEIALSQIFMAGRICEEIVDKILPPADPSRKDQPKMGIAVLQDQHILGKRMVYSVLRASGFELKDLGSGLSADELIEAVYDNNLEVLLISALMLNAALQVKKVTQRFQEDNKQIIVVVGGAPFKFDSELWKEVGADAMGRNASDAATVVNKIIEGLI